MRITAQSCSLFATLVVVVVVLTRAYTGYVEPEVSVTARAGEAPTPHLGRPLMDLKVVNDVSENAVQMATDYKELITKDETQRKMLMVGVAQQRRDRSDLHQIVLQPTPNKLPSQNSHGISLRRS